MRPGRCLNLRIAYFWDEPANACDEWELEGADVEAALDWARSAADGRTFKLYAVVKQPGEVGLIRVHGTDPTAP